jgi:replicative DNA helicase
MNREIEIQVIAHLIDEPKNYHVYSARISEELFSEYDLREIFIAYVLIVKDGRKPDAVNLTKNDESRIKLLEIISGISFMAEFESWLSMLTDKWKERRLDNIILKSQALKGDTIQDTINTMQSELASLNDVNINRPKIISEHIKDVLISINDNKGNQELTGVNTGLALLNKFTGGWQPSDLVIIAGDTSQGKTSLALQFGRVAGLSGVGVGIYSFEMSTKQLTARLISQETGISSKNILIGRVEEYQLSSMGSKLIKLDNTEIYIDECSSTRLNYLLNSMTALNLVNNVKLFVVDYLQLLSNPNKSGNKEQEMGGIARELKNFAKRTNTTVLLLSQLNRGQNKRIGSEPKLSDLRDSGQIEEAADIVILTYRPDVYGIDKFGDGTDCEGLAEIIIAKGRNIGLAKFKLEFNKELTLFSNYNEQSIGINQHEPFNGF